MGYLYLHLRFQICRRTSYLLSETLFDRGWSFYLVTPFEVDHHIDRLLCVVLFANGQSLVTLSQDGELDV